MKLKRGDASALTTKLINESTGYITTLAALLVLNLIIFKKGHDGLGTLIAVIFVTCAVGLFCYWIGHLVESCIEFRRRYEDTKMASLHAFAILMCLLFSYTGALVIAIITLVDSFLK